MRRLLSIIGLAFGLLLLSAPVASADPAPTTVTKPCTDGNVQCEGESSDDVPAGRWCSFDHDGDPATPALEGKTNKHGQCVCATPPATTTTSTTVPETTTTTAPTTSTTVVQPSTTVSPTTEEPPTTVAPLPNRPADQTPTTTVRFNQARAQGELPRTGADGTLLTAAVGASLVLLGAALVWAARRRLI